MKTFNMARVGIAALSLFTIVACGPIHQGVDVPVGSNPEANKNVTGMPDNGQTGTADGGGGTIDSSTPEEIKEAIDTIRGELLKIDFIFFAGQVKATAKFSENNISEGRHGLFKIFNPQIQWINDHMKELDEINPGNDLETDAQWEKTQESFENYAKKPKTFEDWLGTLKVKLMESGPCPSADNDHADASVSAAQWDAEVCFSLETLTRIPRQSLKAQIAGLWMHELGHMLGFDEPVAKNVERVTALAYPQIALGTKAGISDIVMHSLMATFNTLNVAEGQLSYYLYVRESKLQDQLDSSQHLVRTYAYLASAISYTDVFIEFFGEKKYRAPKIFDNPEFDDVRRQLVADMKELRKTASELLDTPVSSLDEQMKAKIQDLIKVSKKAMNTFSDIRHGYDDYYSPVIKN